MERPEGQEHLGRKPRSKERLKVMAAPGEAGRLCFLSVLQVSFMGH